MLRLRFVKPLPQRAFIRQYSNLRQSYDVLIVGAGMAGSSLACALGKAPLTKHLKIGIIDRQPPKELHPLPKSPDLRVFSISQSSTKLFQAMGVWDAMAAARATPFRDMKVWDANNANISFSYHDTKEAELGHILEHHVIQGALADCIKQVGNTDFILSDSTLSVNLPTNPDEPVQVQVGNETVSTKLLVGADGATSWVREVADIHKTGFRYNQVAIVATIKTTEPHSTAFQRFLPSGPVALLPLHENFSSIVWTTNPYQTKLLKGLSNEAFLEQLLHAFTRPNQSSTNSFASLIEGIFSSSGGPANENYLPEGFPSLESVVGPRASFPLQTFHVHEYTKPRLALLGDASHVVHPFAGQGINLGFSDVLVLVNNIAYSIQTGSDIGCADRLREYGRARTAGNLPMMIGLDSMKRVWESNFSPVVHTRKLGLEITKLVPGIKDLFVSQAEGATLDFSVFSVE